MADTASISARDHHLAVIGFDVLTENAANSKAFESVVYSGVPLPETAGFCKDLLEPERALFGLNEDRSERLDLENALLLRVAARSLLSSFGTIPPRTAFLFFRASELSAAVMQRFAPGDPAQTAGSDACLQFQELLSGFPGNWINLSLTGHPLSAGLQEAQRLLYTGAADQVLIAGAATRASIDPVIRTAGIKLDPGPRRFGFDQNVAGWSFGEGAAAVLLMGVDSARSANCNINAIITGIGLAAKELTAPRRHIIPTFVSAETVALSCQRAFQDAAVPPDEIGYLDAFASGFPPLDAAEIAGLTDAYAGTTVDLTTALGSAQAIDGYLPAVTGLLALIRSMLCLRLRLIPPQLIETGPKNAERFTRAPFYLASEPRTWFLPAALKKRTASVSSIGWDGSCLHLLLQEEPQRSVRVNSLQSLRGGSLFPLAVDNLADLHARLSALRAGAAGNLDLVQQSRSAVDVFRQARPTALAACLVASDVPELQKEIDSALRDISLTEPRKSPWQTPAGSYFTPDPVGPSGEVVFVYPGGFNSYLGLGRELFFLFPHLHSLTHNLTADLGETLQERQLYPRGLNPLDKDRLKELEARLNADPIAMITSGSVMAVLYTHILRDIFHVHPAAAMGYSLGEIGMLFALQAWDQADPVKDALRSSPLFREELSGPKYAVRRHWSLPLEDGSSAALWENHFLMAPFELVNNALAREDRVYLTHINTSRQVVIGGDPAACARVIASLKCTSLRAPFDFALHCAAIQTAYKPLVKLLTWPVAQPPAARLLTAAGCTPLEINSTAIAESISTMLCNPIDFPTLVHQAYAQGARVFIELGANANCTKWIEENLKGQPFAAVAVNRKGASDLESLLKMLARLVSHRVPLDLSPLYN